MKKRILGRTGIEVPELSMGGLFIASFGGPFEQARETVKKALSVGIDFVDTAPGYGDSEAVLGKIFETTGRPRVLSTKLGGYPQPFEPKNRKHLLSSVENSLKLLGTDHIDILIVHEPDRPGQYDWWDDYENYAGPVTDVIDELKKSGKIKYSGLGGTTVTEMLPIVKTGKFDVLLTAFNYSLLWREAGRILIPEAKAQGMGIILGSPLQQGALARRYDETVKKGARWLSPHRREQYEKLYALLDELGLDLAQTGMRFALSN